MPARIKKVYIEEQIIKGRRLGRHVEHDPRSKAFGVVGQVEIHTVRHRTFGQVLDQGNRGSCTGNATAGALNTKGLHRPGTKVLYEPDAISLYSLATQLDNFPGNYPPDDTGSSGLAVAKAAQQKGYILEYRHAFSLNEALQGLMAGPVITGVNWYEGFDKPDPNGIIKIAGQVRGGHEFFIGGYDAKAKLLTAVNSWGMRYGKNGKFFIPLDVWDQLLSEQGDCTILVN